MPLPDLNLQIPIFEVLQGSKMERKNMVKAGKTNETSDDGETMVFACCVLVDMQ
jgi:hypothetical protein